MDFEFWWLLSWPFFFALGWLAARIDIRHLLRESRSLPRSYLSGLSFLVNEQPDKAIDAFLDALRIDPQTVELHFALGSLFRRRGEVDRAIRIHQNLVEREDLSEEQSLQALEALGQDYLKAGLLDRAEAAYMRLRDSARKEVALRALLEIYQQEKNWTRAIEIAQEMPANDHRWEKEIANFHCELATVDFAHSDHAAALAQIDAALRVNSRCVRALMLQGDVLLSQGQEAEALAAWKRVEQMDPAFLSQVAERIMAAYQRAGEAERGIQLLRYYLDRYPSLDLLEFVFQWDMEHGGAQQAYILVRDEIKRNPTVLGLDKLLEAAVFTVPADKRQDVELIKRLINDHTRRVARYRCDHCGFKARQFYWRCPACGDWESYPPRRTEEFDLVP
ncbi:lipopolysaccharide assembly protein LapB [Uliginosibacterium sediminicola]|uniref:Lipopolysaccharide assembly protein B n=1 Tax=Uliginosibacterium sediminicola TaxID=2024550 RepID=A0ABU9Z0L8_9RHOO